MTFFDKLFTTKNKFFRCEINPTLSCNRSSDAGQCFELRREQVRVLLFRECERRGRKLLFDSDAVEKIPADCTGRYVNHPDVVEIGPTYAYKYKKPNKDVSSLGEMIFGSVAIATKGGTTSKIHNIPSPHRLVFTTVMPTNVRCRSRSSKSHQGSSGLLSERLSDVRDSGSYSSDSSIHRCTGTHQSGDLLSPECMRSTGLHRSAGSNSLRTMTLGPSCCESRLSTLRTCCDDVQSAPSSRRTSDSPSCGLNSCRSSFFSSFVSQCDSRSSNQSVCSGGSLNSLRRRWNQSLAVSLDMSSCDEGDDTSVRVRTKLGLALVLNLSGPHQSELQKFLLNNSLTIESILEVMREKMVTAYSLFEMFVHLSDAATEAAAASLLEVVMSRQNIKPRWLRLLSEAHPSRSSRNTDAPVVTACDRFVFTFCSILQAVDTKDSNFFVSTLLTSLLTYNLGWVASVVAKTKSSKADALHESQVTQGRYNPLWAQHRELFGAVSNPARSAKIVIADSQGHPLLSDLLDVLSFFLRCTTVLEHCYEGDFTDITDLEMKHKVVNETSKNTSYAFTHDVDETWAADENFDSGVDCEIKGSFLSSRLEPDTSRKVCYDVLVKSASERNYNHSLNTLYPTQKPDCELLTGVSDKLTRTKDFFSNLFRKDCSNSSEVISAVGAGKGKFVDSFVASEGSRDCCNSLKNSCSNRTVRENKSKINGHSSEKKNVDKATHVIARDSSLFFMFSDQCHSNSDNMSCRANDITAATEEKKVMNKEEVYLHNASLKDPLYPSIEALALLENVRLEDLTTEREKTLFVQEVLEMADNLIKQNLPQAFSNETCPEDQDKSPTPDEGYDTLDGESSLATEKNVLFTIGDSGRLIDKTLVSEATMVEPEPERPRRRRRPSRSRTVNIPVVEALKILKLRSRTMEDVAKECCLEQKHPLKEPIADPTNTVKFSATEQRFMRAFQELPLPVCGNPVKSRVLPLCPVIGGVSPVLHPQYALQAVTRSAAELEDEVRKDLALMAAAQAHLDVLSEAVYIVADVSKWDVCVHSSQHTALVTPKSVRSAASQLVADMLESFALLHRHGFSATFCLTHLEQKLAEIYQKSEAVAELLMTTEFCTVDLLTSSLHISVNDVPLLLSVATTHTPELAEKYGITFS